IAELAVELHLQLTLVADHRGRLLGKRLVLPLSFLDGLLDLYLRVGVLVDLRRERRHQVLPELHERVGHLLRLPSCNASIEQQILKPSCQVRGGGSTEPGRSPGRPWLCACTGQRPVCQSHGPGRAGEPNWDAVTVEEVQKRSTGRIRRQRRPGPPTTA